MYAAVPKAASESSSRVRIAFAVVSRLCLIPLRHKCSLSACARCQLMRGVLPSRGNCAETHTRRASLQRGRTRCKRERAAAPPSPRKYCGTRSRVRHTRSSTEARSRCLPASPGGARLAHIACQAQHVQQELLICIQLCPAQQFPYKNTQKLDMN